MRNIVRKYPSFADMRAALTAVLWEQGKHGEAESNWVAAVGLDQRYKDINWVAHVRRWPPSWLQRWKSFRNSSRVRYSRDPLSGEVEEMLGAKFTGVSI